MGAYAGAILGALMIVFALFSIEQALQRIAAALEDLAAKAKL